MKNHIIATQNTHNQGDKEQYMNDFRTFINNRKYTLYGNCIFCQIGFDHQFHKWKPLYKKKHTQRGSLFSTGVKLCNAGRRNTVYDPGKYNMN